VGATSSFLSLKLKLARRLLFVSGVARAIVHPRILLLRGTPNHACTLFWKLCQPFRSRQIFQVLAPAIGPRVLPLGLQARDTPALIDRLLAGMQPTDRTYHLKKCVTPCQSRDMIHACRFVVQPHALSACM
jgi:hypothetical protein